MVWLPDGMIYKKSSRQIELELEGWMSLGNEVFPKIQDLESYLKLQYPEVLVDDQAFMIEGTPIGIPGYKAFYVRGERTKTLPPFYEWLENSTIIFKHKKK